MHTHIVITGNNLIPTVYLSPYYAFICVVRYMYINILKSRNQLTADCYAEEKSRDGYRDQIVTRDVGACVSAFQDTSTVPVVQ